MDSLPDGIHVMLSGAANHFMIWWILHIRLVAAQAGKSSYGQGSTVSLDYALLTPTGAGSPFSPNCSAVYHDHSLNILHRAR